jgi:hypothetical protein
MVFTPPAVSAPMNPALAQPIDPAQSSTLDAPNAQKQVDAEMKQQGVF